MATLLHVDASARVSRSLSRELSRHFVDTWRSHRPGGRIIRRDLAMDPPPYVTEDWIAAAFAAPEQRTEQMRKILAWSEKAISELEMADLIVVGAPMYNYGMPSMLKAWFDQVIRIGRTFSFDLARGDWPLEPILGGKQLVVLSSRGEFGFGPGEMRQSWNHLDPHVATCAHYIGVARDTIRTISIEYQEFGDERHRQSKRDAEARVVELARELATIRNGHPDGDTAMAMTDRSRSRFNAGTVPGSDFAKL